MNMNLTFSNGINMVLNMTTPGAKGESISDVTLNPETGMLTVTLTNGVSKDVGNVETIVAAVEARDAAIVAKETAEAKATVAQQALNDLIAILGSSVATLGGDGKLTASQIPAISIIKVVDVATEEARLLLTDVQRGDVCRIVVDGAIGNTYILNGTDPSVDGNWAQLGDGYVAEAGHALNADNAVDSQQINGHRLITYDAATFSGAVKDADTLYAVFEGA